MHRTLFLIDLEMIPDKIYISTVTLSSNEPGEQHLLPDWHLRPNPKVANIEYIRKDVLLDWVKLAYGKVSMNPFDCLEAFEELINKLELL